MVKRIRPNARLAAVILGGICMGATAAPIRAWPLAWVALVPLWATVSLSSEWPVKSLTQSIRVAVGYGFVWGFLYSGITMHWLWSLHPLTWMGVPWLASLAIAAFCWGTAAIAGGLWMGSWAALFTGLTTWIAARRGDSRQSWSYRTGAIVHRILLGLGLWVGLDAMMQQGILYWPSLALTQSPDNLAALHLSRLSGPSTLSVAIVAVNALLAEAWLQARQQSGGAERATERPLSGGNSITHSLVPSSRSLIALALGTLLSAHGLGLLLFYLPAESGTPLTVGIIQGNIPTRIKLYSDGIRRALQGYTRGYHALVDGGAELVVLPEGALPFRWLPDRPADGGENPMAKAIRDRGVAAVVGTFATKENHLTQSLLAVAGNGQIVGRYDKVKLVPLGEYIPLQNSLGRVISRLSPIQSDMVPGQYHQAFQTPVGQAIAGICYESAFSHLFRNQAAAGGTVIITASNNDPYPPAMMAQHHAQDLMRAIETNRWAVRATNTGYSGIIDPRGRTRWRADANRYVLKLATVEQRTTQTIYVRWGDWLTPLLLAANALWLMFWRRTL
ncbi:MAG: apolipoprotein N-acyltransferase [Elainellaceae cyanobacterium]